MLTLLLFACYALALVAAYRVASRLAPSSLTHAAALTILFWIVNLILPVTYVGMVNLLRVEAMVIAGALLWGGEIVLAGRIRPLMDSDDGARRGWQIGLGWLCLLVCIAAYGYVYFYEVPRLPQFLPVLEVDAAWQNVPVIIDMLNAGTLHFYETFFPYYPLAFEILFAWEIALTHSYTFAPIFQYALLMGGLLYLALLARWLLRTRPAIVADLTIVVLLLVLLRSDHVLSLVYNAGKGDILLLTMAAAGVYYLVRFWDGDGDTRLLMLAGIASGLLISAKLSAITWLVPLGAAHIVFRLHRREGRMLVRDALLIGLAGVIMALPWGVRLLFYTPTASYAEFSALGIENTILRAWQRPQYIAPTAERAHELLLVGGGLLLILLTSRWNRRYAVLFVQIAGAIMLLAGLVAHVEDTWRKGVTLQHNFTPFLMMLVGSGVVALVGWRARRLLSPAITAVHALVALSMIVFSVVPYSAWAYPVPYLFEATWYNINYRYTPASLPLFVTATLATSAYLLTRQLSRDVPARAAAPGRGRHVLAGGALLLLLLIGLGWRFTTYDVNRLLDRYANFNWRLPQPTGFFHWFYDAVRDARVYAINAPPLPLYGRDFTNQVFYATEGHTGFYGDQAYRWDEVQRLIEERQLDYIVISFNYPEVMQSALAPTPDVLAEIEQMRANLRTVYQDEQVTMFATHYAQDIPAPPA